MITGSIDIIAGTGLIAGTDIWATIEEALHEDTNNIGKDLQDLVRNLTPIRTGALLMDISYEAYLDPGNDDLVWIYAEEIAQEAYYNRVYVQYQEGGPLGEHTYTNDPHEMFYETSQGDGQDLVMSWASDRVQHGIDLCVAGAGIPL